MLIARTPDGQTAPIDGSTFELVDSQAYIDIGFASDPGRSASGLEWLRGDEQNGLFWYRWWPLGGRDPSKSRRMGAYSLTIPSSQATVTAYIRSAKIFSEEQYLRMLQEIMDFSSVAVWDSADERGRVRVESRAGAPYDGKSAAVSLVSRIKDELRVARAGLPSLPWELAPGLPGQHITDGGYRKDFDISENRALLSWSHSRLDQLRTTLTECQHALEFIRHEEETARQLGSAEPAPSVLSDRKALDTICSALQDLAAEVQRVHLHLRAKGVSVSCWLVTPSVTRNPHVAPLIQEIRAQSQTPYSSELHTARLSILAQRLTSSLYELWAALAVAKILDHMGFTQCRQPVVNTGIARQIDSLVLPHRIMWEFERDDLKVRWYFCPHVAILDPGSLPEPTRSLRLAPRDRLAEVARLGEFRDVFVTPVTTNTPDYIIQIEIGGSTAFAVADATYSDAHQDGGGALRSKGKKIRTKYAQKILWINRVGLATACSEPASFAISPVVPSENSTPPPSSDEVFAIELAPWDHTPPPQALAGLSSVINSLEWICRRTAEAAVPSGQTGL